MDANVSFAIISLLISACLVLKAVDRSRDAAAAGHKFLTGILIDRHNRRIAKQTAKLNGIAYCLSDHRDQTDCRSLLVFTVVVPFLLTKTVALPSSDNTSACLKLPES